MGIGDDGFDLDLAAASLGADSPDVQIMLGQLAERLTVLADRCKVERAGGLFRKKGQIRSVEITVGGSEFVASLEGTSPEFRIGRVSGGVRIRTERTDAAGWSRALVEALRAEAAHSSEARAALEAIVIGEP